MFAERAKVVLSGSIERAVTLKGVFATKGAQVRKPVEQYEMLRPMREFLQWREGDAIILGEANVLPGTDLEYFGRAGERLQMMFNFQVNQHLFYALATADSRTLVKALKSTKSHGRPAAVPPAASRRAPGCAAARRGIG